MVTMDAKQGVELIRLINPRLAISIHFEYATFANATLAQMLTPIRSLIYF